MTPTGFPSIGTIYGVLLNDPETLQRMDEAFHAAPYREPPKAPVLYIKPRNTFAGPGSTVRIPPEPGEVEINATLGLLIGRRATRVSSAEALSHVAGYLLVSDLSLPHASVYRPALRQRCRDGFLPMAVPVAGDFDPATLQVTTHINGRQVHRRGFASLVRPPAQLLADVTSFMTLAAGDVLLLGTADDAVLARPGDEIEIDAGAMGRLAYRLELEQQEARP